MKILVTGAAGFIGYHTINRLITDGHEVVGVDNLCDPVARILKLARLSLLGIDVAALAPSTPQHSNAGSFSFILMDILNRAEVEALCQAEKFDRIIHLAALAGTKPSLQRPSDFFEVNTYGTQIMLEAAKQSGVQHFFFTSSYVVHGEQANSPLREDDAVDTPMSMYAASKRSAELLCHAYASAYKLPITVFRLFTAYGPWGRPDSKPMQIAKAIVDGTPITIMNNGHLVRDFTYVDDVIDGMMTALDMPPNAVLHAPYALYNIGRSKPVSLLSFIQTLEAALGNPANVESDPASPHTKGENVEMYADNTKLERELAYSPVWDYEEAAPLFANWFKENYKITFNM